MWVTCYTDASFSRKDGGAWGVWLRSAHGRVVRHGRCPAYVKNSTAAELAAVYAGVYLALRHWPSTTGVLVCADAQSALALLEPDARLARDPGTRRLQERLREQCATHGISLQARWVKGHQPKNAGTAAYLNRECDRIARIARRAPRPAPPPRSPAPAPKKPRPRTRPRP